MKDKVYLVEVSMGRWEDTHSYIHKAFSRPEDAEVEKDRLIKLYSKHPEFPLDYDLQEYWDRYGVGITSPEEDDLFQEWDYLNDKVEDFNGAWIKEVVVY